MLNAAFGESSMYKRKLYKYKYKCFQKGSEDAEMMSALNTLAHQQSMSVKKVKKMIMDNHQITIGEVAKMICDVDISFVSCQAIFCYVLGMRCVTAKFVKIVDKYVEIIFILNLCWNLAKSSAKWMLGVAEWSQWSSMAQTGHN